MEPSRDAGERLAVMHLSGEMDAATTPGLDLDVEGVLAGPAPSILVLEVSEVRFWDSAGLGLIVRAVKTAKAQGHPAGAGGGASAAPPPDGTDPDDRSDRDVRHPGGGPGRAPAVRAGKCQWPSLDF